MLDAIPAPKKKSKTSKGALTLSPLQPVRRDFAFVMDRAVPAATVLRAANGADKKLIAGVTVFDVFEGASLGENAKSLAIEVTLQPMRKSLTDEEIDAVCRKGGRQCGIVDRRKAARLRVGLTRCRFCAQNRRFRESHSLADAVLPPYIGLHAIPPVRRFP